MSTALAFLILISPFALAALLTWAANRSGSLRLHIDQFRWAAPMTGRLFEDRDSDRVLHDVDAIRTRFEEHPSWPVSSASGERR
ncbi:hypothetical protein PDG61_02245 [Mycolicibacterium sp. BiH015]|uniref:hypothetical protein n=1 Tax=Mycolicibacterium sp. BiH015 TaxID=3018808 RepID=UPI0022E16298|nr:hypothetical protein [Mycolicibacterium sp. BiH015]MDA2889725.1 hypothetical protein [Mycolicibacterium sp. BiH015]